MEQFQPVTGLLKLLKGAFDLTDEVRIRFRSLRLVIMSANRGSRSQHLASEDLRLGLSLQT